MRQLWLCIAMTVILSFNACNSTATNTIPETDQPSVSIIRTPSETAITTQATLKPTELPTTTAAPPTATRNIPQPTTTPSPESSPPLEILNTQPCLYASGFVEDITIQDSSIVPVGQQVEKVWRIRNTGTCSWEEGTSLIHIKAQRFDAPDKIPVPATAPGEEVDVRITFTTPKTSGIYESYWRLENAQGELFGGVLFMRLKTSASIKAATPTLPSATFTPTETATAIPTQKPVPTVTPTIIPTVTPTAVPTLKPTETQVPGCGEYNPQFMGVLSQASMLRLNVGCALGAISHSNGIVQEFWINVDNYDAHQRFRSLMLKNEDTGTIYVFVGKDTLTFEATVAVFEDQTFNFADGGYACEAPTPPTGYSLPQNNFTKLWCDNQYWEVVGWPKQKEAPADLVIQRTEKGVLIWTGALPGTPYYLALNLDTGQGTVQMGP